MMTLSVSYPINQEMKIEARQMYDQRATRPVTATGEGAVRKTTRGELSLRGDMNHKFNNDFALLASVQRTQSTAEDSFWTINASIQKRF